MCDKSGLAQYLENMSVPYGEILLADIVVDDKTDRSQIVDQENPLGVQRQIETQANPSEAQDSNQKLFTKGERKLDLEARTSKN